jgi:GxxExxY protein
VNRQGAKNAKGRAHTEPCAEADAAAREVIGAAIEVHRALGPGFLESVYHDAMCVELVRRGVPFGKEVAIAVEYKGVLVGAGRLDLLVADVLVVELKAVHTVAPIHLAQTLAYLKAARLQLGLILNFNVLELRQGLRRVVHNP